MIILVRKLPDQWRFLEHEPEFEAGVSVTFLSFKIGDVRFGSY